MKKLLLVLAVILLPVITMGQTWHTANQVTVAWDAVPPIAIGDVIKYQVYTKTSIGGIPVKVDGEITSTSSTITFSQEGRYFIGVQTMRYPTGETVGIPSVKTAWSDVAVDCASAGPFGIVYYVPPPAPGGMRNATVQ